MLAGLDHLGIEVRSTERAAGFYRDRLGLDPTHESEDELVVPVGPTDLVCRRPDAPPRGGLHTHYALSTPAAEYDDWLDRLGPLDPAEFDFGSLRSLYVFDPDGHCVEVAARDVAGAGLVGVFEVVLEVRRLAPAERAYRALGFDVIDRGDDRRRTRLRGPVDLELWEPQTGIAGARGGVHVDLGFAARDPAGAADAMGEWVAERDRIDRGLRVRDRDGHVVSFVES